MNISTKEIEKITDKVSRFVINNKNNQAFKILKPILDNKVAFVKLDKIGELIGEKGKESYTKFYSFFNKLVEYNAMGSYVIVGRALVSFLDKDFAKVMKKNREYIVVGNVWYVCDIIGERSLGQALVDYFDKTLLTLKIFLKDKNKWIRRSVGVAIHFFNKRVQDNPQKTKKLLKLIEPYMEEKQIDVVKGIGWGLKTIGKYHSKIATDFLIKQIKEGKKLSGTIKRKALEKLDSKDRKKIENLLKEQQIE